MGTLLILTLTLLIIDLRIEDIDLVGPLSRNNAVVKRIGALGPPLSQELLLNLSVVCEASTLLRQSIAGDARRIDPVDS